MKKLFSMALALVMAMSLTVPAFAVEKDDSVNAGDTTTGSITVTNPDADEDYDLYRLLDLESYNKAAKAYAYKLNAKWKAFFEQNTVKDVYVNIDAQEYVTWVTGADPAAFAKLALKYAEDNNIKADFTGKTTYDNIPLGYYLIDSSLGTLCSLTTTDNVVEITEKNAKPTLKKEVQEDSNNTFGETNTADIGQTVTFKATITAQEGADSYVMHDEMSVGLTYTAVTSVTLNNVEVAASDYTVKAAELSDDCDFEVIFAQAFCDTLKDNDVIVVTYTAVVNENAVIDGDGNDNEAWLSYGDDNTTTTADKTTTYTYDFNVKKYTMVDGAETDLAGAEFKLSQGAASNEAIKFVAIEGGYRVATADDKNTTTTLVAGNIKIEGLDADTYYLTETKAPDGYNLLPTSIKITIEEDGDVLEGDVTTPVENDLIKVLNQTGALLPSTGGMGTTIFTVVGATLMLGAAVLLVTKKKMSNEE